MTASDCVEIYEYSISEGKRNFHLFRDCTSSYDAYRRIGAIYRHIALKEGWTSECALVGFTPEYEQITGISKLIKTAARYNVRSYGGDRRPLLRYAFPEKWEEWDPVILALQIYADTNRIPIKYLQDVPDYPEIFLAFRIENSSLGDLPLEDLYAFFASEKARGWLHRWGLYSLGKKYEWDTVQLLHDSLPCPSEEIFRKYHELTAARRSETSSATISGGVKRQGEAKEQADKSASGQAEG